MLDFTVKIEPYTYQNECGDFYIYEEFEEYYLIVVGDIGGHGSQNIFEIANEIQMLILQNSDLEIGAIFKIIDGQKEIKKIGAVLFIGKIFKSLQILKYGQIGNIKGQFIREKKLTELFFQEGILGFNIPQTINTNILKIQKGDILLLTTNGLSLYNSKLQNILNQTSTVEIAQFCIDNFFKHNDDGLCFVLKYENQVTNENFSQKELFNPPTYLKSTEEKEEFPKETKKFKIFKVLSLNFKRRTIFLPSKINTK